MLGEKGNIGNVDEDKKLGMVEKKIENIMEGNIEGEMERVLNKR